MTSSSFIYWVWNSRWVSLFVELGRDLSVAWALWEGHGRYGAWLGCGLGALGCDLGAFGCDLTVTWALWGVTWALLGVTGVWLPNTCCQKGEIWHSTKTNGNQSTFRMKANDNRWASMESNLKTIRNQWKNTKLTSTLMKTTDNYWKPMNNQWTSMDSISLYWKMALGRHLNSKVACKQN